jgi:hypothetical protein
MATTYKVLGQVAGTATTDTYNTISNKALTSNVATLTTAATHSYAIGDLITIAGVDTTLDGTYVVASVPTTTTFTYALTATNITSAAVSPVGIASRNITLYGVAINNKVKKNNTATLTTSSSHNLSVGDTVYISIGDTTIQGRYLITGVPSATLFSVTAAGSDIASAACGGAFGKLGIVSTNLYTVPASTSTVVSTITVTNRSTGAKTYRIAIRPAAAALANQHYLAYDVPIAANDTTALTLGVTLAATDVVTVSSSTYEVSFAIFGSEIS